MAVRRQEISLSSKVQFRASLKCYDKCAWSTEGGHMARRRAKALPAFQGPQNGSSIPLSRPKISCNPVIPRVIFSIQPRAHAFQSRILPRIKGNPGSRKTYWGPSAPECEQPFIDKPIVKTKPAIASTQLLGQDLKLYPSNMQRMLNKDLTRFMQSLSWELRNCSSERGSNSTPGFSPTHPRRGREHWERDWERCLYLYGDVYKFYKKIILPLKTLRLDRPALRNKDLFHRDHERNLKRKSTRLKD